MSLFDSIRSRFRKWKAPIGYQVVECHVIADLQLGANENEMRALANSLGVPSIPNVLIAEHGGVMGNGRICYGSITLAADKIVLFLDAIFAMAMDEQIYQGKSVLGAFLEALHKTYYHEIRHIWQYQKFRTLVNLDLFIWKNLDLVLPCLLLVQALLWLNHSFDLTKTLFLAIGCIFSGVFHMYWQDHYKKWYDHYSVTEQDALEFEKMVEIPDTPLIFFPTQVLLELTTMEVPTSRSH